MRRLQTAIQRDSGNFVSRLAFAPVQMVRCDLTYDRGEERHLSQPIEAAYSDDVQNRMVCVPSNQGSNAGV